MVGGLTASPSSLTDAAAGHGAVASADMERASGDTDSDAENGQSDQRYGAPAKSKKKTLYVSKIVGHVHPFRHVNHI